MKKVLHYFWRIVSIVLTALLLTGCQPSDNGNDKEQPTRTVVELNENNYWKYFTVSYDMNNLNAGGKGRFCYDIKGVLDYALYEELYFHLTLFIMPTVKRRKIIKAIQ